MQRGRRNDRTSTARSAFCNDYTLAITGWSTGRPVGRPAPDLLGLDCSARTGRSLPAGRKVYPLSESAIHREEWRPTLDPVEQHPVARLGRPRGRFASLGEDVTELRALRTEAARRESEERFRDIADIAPLMIWVAGPDKGCTFVNKGWLAFSGRTLEEELGDGWLGGVHPDDRRLCQRQPIAAAFDARRSFQVEKRMRGPTESTDGC